VVPRRGRWKTVCARGADPALPCGRSASPLDGVMSATAYIRGHERTFAAIALAAASFVSVVNPGDLKCWGTFGGCWVLILVKTAPYVLCAVFWLPWRSAFARSTAMDFSLVLLTLTVFVHAPSFFWPGRTALGDMYGLGVIIYGVVGCLLVAVGSAIACVVEFIGRARRTREDD